MIDWTVSSSARHPQAPMTLSTADLLAVYRPADARNGFTSGGSGAGVMPLLWAHQTTDSGSGRMQSITELLHSKGLADLAAPALLAQQGNESLPATGAAGIASPLPAGQAHGPHSQGTGELSFADPIDYAGGRNPRSVTSGDFRGIGIQDLAVANAGSNDVSIFLGNGNGTFRLVESVVVGGNPSFITTGHFHDATTVDLAVANAGSNDVSILLGHGDGSFGLPHNVAVGRNPQSIAVGAFHGGGIDDLALANQGSNNVSILLGNGDGTFAPAANVAVQGPATSVAVADLNGDGKVDLAVTTTGPAFRPGFTLPGAVSIFLGNGDGTFQSGQTLTVGVLPNSVAIGDFRGNGIKDLAVANISPDNVSILLGKGDGTFAPATSYQVGGQPTSIAVADINGDGIQDLVTANQYSTASVLLGNGDGTFRPTQDFGAGSQPVSVVVGDFNGDGLPDLAVANVYTNQVSVLLNNTPQQGDGVTIVRNIVYYDGPYSNPHRQNLDVYLPAAKTDFPVVFLVFGGAFRVGNKSKLGYLARTLAREGLGVVTPNYRITDGGPEQVIHPGHVTDAARAFAWTYNHIGEYGGNVDKIILMGHSSGGTLISCLATDRRYLAAQGLSPDIVKGVIGVSAGTYDLRILWPGWSDVFGDLEQHWEASPLKYVDGTQPPWLVLYGSDDNSGFPEDSRNFYQALVQAGSQAEMHEIANHNHGGMISRMALPGDPGRDLVLRFIREHTR
jgi:acetyl esterase/lipase